MYHTTRRGVKRQGRQGAAWELFGALLGMAGWLLALSPFHDLGIAARRALAVHDYSSAMEAALGVSDALGV